MPALKAMEGTRIVAAPAAIDAASWPEGALAWRLAPDEVLVSAAVDSRSIADPHAIVERETGYSALWLKRAAALEFLQRECDWEFPHETPAFAQGIVAGLPVKIGFESDRVLFIVASPFAIDLEERLR